LAPWCWSSAGAPTRRGWTRARSALSSSHAQNHPVLLSFRCSRWLPATGNAKANGITVKIKDASGKDVGTVNIKPSGTGVSLKLDLHGLAPGEHAIHFHQNAKCEAPDFKSAGPHFNPESQEARP
jgi:Cu/Zn superoxide dismutase